MSACTQNHKSQVIDYSCDNKIIVIFLHFVFLLVLLLITCPASIAAPQKKLQQELVFDLDAVPVSQVLRLVYGDALLSRSYFLDPAVVSDSRPVSFRYKSTDGDIQVFLTNFLAALGYKIEAQGKADFVRPLQNPAPVEDRTQKLLIYRPKHRNTTYLQDLVSSLFRGAFTGQRTVTPGAGSTLTQQSGNGSAPQGTAIAQITQDRDVLVFHGTAIEIRELQKLLEELDRPQPQVMVEAVLYEVSTDRKTGSAFSLITTLLGGKLQGSIGSAATTGNYLKIGIGGFQAIAQILDQDSRFKTLTNPRLRVLDGDTARLQVGDSVPVLSGISQGATGTQPIQQVSYQDSGVIFNLQPSIYREGIDLRISEQVSNFVPTTTGVTASPTKQSRQLDTRASLQDGEVIILGGLAASKDASSESGPGWLPSILKSKSADQGQSELVMMLTVHRL